MCVMDWMLLSTDCLLRWEIIMNGMEEHGCKKTWFYLLFKDTTLLVKVFFFMILSQINTHATE